MKKFVILAIIILLVGGYLGRNNIKSILGISPASSQSQTVQSTPSTSSAIAPSDNIYLIKKDPSKGQYLTDFQGTALYTYDKDTKGVSNCTGTCARIWPFYTSGATAEKLLPTNISVITRSDGSKQFAWKRMPLYYYSADKKPSDITGDGVGGVWHIVKP
ncbi:MAG TPA: hypothetical protein VNW29_04425 [Candidatus Sulfotelmatobacter sp.]|jgi:predicted lipoprotein with Yx(FWY)xxD motif|nr:hypothetical protein [Candidatus Sulfotelmatobacter sp.]